MSQSNSTPKMETIREETKKLVRAIFHKKLKNPKNAQLGEATTELVSRKLKIRSVRF
jgi:hypothetical protein